MTMELLGLGVWFLFIYVLSNAAQDFLHAWRGTENPRLKLKLAQARQAGKARYGVRDYVADLWSDALQARTERRRQKAHDDGPPVIEDLEPVVLPTPDLGRPPTPLPAPLPDPPPPPPEPPTPTPPANIDDPPRRWQPVIIPGGAGTEPEDQTAPEPTRTEENHVMPTATADILGLNQSISYAEDLAKEAASHGPAEAEGYIGHLQSRNVTGAAIATAQAMQQAAEALRAAAEAHAEELRKQRNVQEAYDQTPDAGDQAYMQQGR